MNKMLLLRTSLRAIAHHKIRSSLTMLGIIVGIAAMIATLAIGHGAEERINKELLSMGDFFPLQDASTRLINTIAKLETPLDYTDYKLGISKEVKGLVLTLAGTNADTKDGGYRNALGRNIGKDRVTFTIAKAF